MQLDQRKAPQYHWWATWHGSLGSEIIHECPQFVGAADESEPSVSTARELCFWSLWVAIAGGSGISDRRSPSFGTCSRVAGGMGDWGSAE